MAKVGCDHVAMSQVCGSCTFRGFRSRHPKLQTQLCNEAVGDSERWSLLESMLRLNLHFSPMQALVPVFHSANEIVQTSSLFKSHRNGDNSLNFGRDGLTLTQRAPSRKNGTTFWNEQKLFAVKLCFYCEMLASIIVVVRELVCDLDLRQYMFSVSGFHPTLFRLWRCPTHCILRSHMKP